MWDRSILKSNARLALSGSKYWTAFAACVVAALISNIFTIILGFVINNMSHVSYSYNYGPNNYGYSIDFTDALRSPEVKWLSLLEILVTILVVFPLSVGLSRFFVHNRFGDTKFETLFSSFKHGYGNSVGTMFVTYLITVLWSMLFVIPGIIKSLQYWLVPFLLSDNPNMSGSRARQLSRMMTDGEKGAIFVLYLSFIGWFFLAAIVIEIVGALCGPISMLAATVITSFVTAYVQATFAELYIFLRDRAIQCGMVRPEELGLAPQA
ncbi:DUF975 family protein [Thermocaproicibacter melissae]|jgi:uncharacterized membrane protein|uniref:DUF975 family protein n=1 Tax=Thermocaproicibacter melissae TaxID=2966552 RepID=UPI0024B1492D|nr:DUF975 family protein [Thermocaproicibacter melissae]WBY63861.1 DUF975 family protein [Thermocaproicibacter melissae]